MSRSVSINLQGSNFTLLVIHAHTTCMSKIRLELTEKIKQTSCFFYKNTPIVINVSNINHCTEWFNLYQTISNIGLCIIGVCCCYNDKLKDIIINSGLPILTKNDTIINNKRNYNYEKSIYNDKNIFSTLKTQVIHKPIRSGQKIYAKNRDLIVTANVSPGAEIISDGNIHIYGTMRGRVLAGASGYKHSQVFCTNFNPELISIGGYYWVNDQIPKKFLDKPARIYLQDNTLIIKHILS